MYENVQYRFMCNTPSSSDLKEVSRNKERILSSNKGTSRFCIHIKYANLLLFGHGLAKGEGTRIGSLVELKLGDEILSKFQGKVSRILVVLSV